MLILVIGVFAGLIIANTSLRTMLPGYLQESQRSATEEGLLRLDSLMRVYETNQAYIDNFLRVTDTERLKGDTATLDSVSNELTVDSLMNPSKRESKFVNEMEDRERFNISVLAPLAAESMLFFPVNGDGIFTKESRDKEQGIVILPREESVQCAADGSVIALYYSAPDRGYVIVIQHNKGFVTSYSHVGTPFVSIGDYVNAGQVISLSSAPDSKGVRKFGIRLWHNGLPLIPFDYLGQPERREEMEMQTYEAPRGK